MTKEQEKAFEGRWRFKGFDEYEVRQLSGRDIREYCRDFFEAGILLTESHPLQGDSIVTIQTTVSDGSPSESSFDEFWNLYDKRVGRAKCEKLWSKLTAKEKRDCIQYVPLYVQAQPDKQYRKNPETFLRNKSFYDEIINRDNKEQQRTQRFQQAARVIASYDCED
jgi:hypothetical protein